MAKRRLGTGGLLLVQEFLRQQTLLASVASRMAQARPDDVHGGRVAARRLRSLLKTFGSLFDARWAGLYRQDLRTFCLTFAAAREADVISELLMAHARYDAALSPADLLQLSVTLEAARCEVRADLRRRLAEPEWRVLVSALAARANAAPKMSTLRAGQGDLLDLVDRACRKAVRALKQRPAESSELHELRLQLKACRHALDVVAGLNPGPAEKFGSRLRAAQQAIGQYRDGAAALHWVAQNEDRVGRRVARRLRKALEGGAPALYLESMKSGDRAMAAYRRWRAAIEPRLKT
jgi:CHAD domain-containing protein